MKVAFFGAYDPDYPRVRVFREGFGAQGVEVLELRVPSRVAAPLRATRLAAAWLARARGVDAIVVLAFGHRDVALAAALGRTAGVPVLFDPLVSRWDTQVGDLGRVRARGLTAVRLHWSDRMALSMSDEVLCDTWEHADFFGAEFGIPRRRLSRVPVGADGATFARGEARAPRAKRGGPLDVVYVGGFLPLHGVETILDAAARLEASRGREFARFTLVGAGMLAHRAARDAAAMGLRSVRMVGRIPYAEAMELAVRADVALGIFGATVKAGRVVPHKVFQSLALGVPTITRRSAAVAEFFRDREHLALVPPSDGGALADAIEAVASDPEGSERMARAGRAAAWDVGHPSRVGVLLREAVVKARAATAPGARP